MKLKHILFISPLMLYANEWFITNYEYGKMLYHNPRGISCAKCHGEKAQGKIIAKYKKNGKTVIIKAPNIQHVTYEALKKRLLKYNKLSVMPRYNYLTKKEIEALYLYIHSIKAKK
ncbi:c-type cytochrome [Caminibacter sp.]